jgi:hypothetical protein
VPVHQREQHQEIGNQVAERMETVGHQRCE